MSKRQGLKRDGLRKFADACMLILLLCLMSYQVTGEEKHEWTGILMTLTVIVHQILNRRWYAALFKGKYNLYRSVTTAVNLLLLASMLVTAFCGMSMSEYAVPFLYWARGLIFVRPTHLAMSHWSFVLMGLHLGLHIPLMLGRMKDRARTILTAAGAVLAGIGLWLFFRNGMPNYLFFRVPFAFLDYEKAFWLVFQENALMLSTWVFLGAELAVSCMKRKKKPALILGGIAAAAILGIALNAAFPGDNDLDFDAAWTVPEAQPAETAYTPEPAAQSAAPTELNDGFVLIPAGRFLMGSPETENWRIDDETQHEVSVSAFYIDPYETTQADYTRLMGANPSDFTGDTLPVESISLLDAIRYANARSREAGLSVHYSGGSGLHENVTAGLEKNNIEHG